MLKQPSNPKPNHKLKRALNSEPTIIHTLASLSIRARQLTEDFDVRDCNLNEFTAAENIAQDISQKLQALLPQDLNGSVSSKLSGLVLGADESSSYYRLGENQFDFIKLGAINPHDVEQENGQLADMLSTYSEEQLSHIICHDEIASYFDLIELLPYLSKLLKATGRLIYLGDCQVQLNESTSLQHAYIEEHMQFIAKILGLECCHSLDLTLLAKSQLDSLSLGLEKYSFNQETQCLNEEIKAKSRQYEQGYVAFKLMLFEKKQVGARTEKYQLGYISAQQLALFQSLFIESFAHPMDDELWRWKYQDEVAHSIGCYQAGADKEQKLLGHYGGFARDILFFGQTARAIQIGDTMVAKKERARLTKTGVFHQLARAFLYRYIGYGSPYLLGFGFPNARVMKLAQTLGLYHHAGKMTRLAWSTMSGSKIPESKMLESEASILKHLSLYKLEAVHAKDKKRIDRLWQSMAENCHGYIIGIRNWERLNYRYLKHPQQGYQVLKLRQRLTQRILAVLVLKFTQNECQLIDILCAPKNIHHALVKALAYARQQGAEELSCLISDNLKADFAIGAYTEMDPLITIPHCACTQGPDLSKVNNKWWLMAGDSDFM